MKPSSDIYKNAYECHNGTLSVLVKINNYDGSSLYC
jgi:hypothetical protein